MDADTVIRLRRVVLGLARRLNAASVGEGLTPTQASVLSIVAYRGQLGLAELTEMEGLNPTMLSRVVGRLDAFGLIRRLRDPDDFRAARVEVTPEGKQAYQRIAAQRAAILSERVASLPPRAFDHLCPGAFPPPQVPPPQPRPDAACYPAPHRGHVPHRMLSERASLTELEKV